MIADLHIDASPAPIALRFRPLTGRIEAALEGLSGTSDATALWLAEALVETVRAGGEEMQLTDLTLPEFDRLLCYLLAVLVGQTTQCHAACETCGEAFEFQVDLEMIRVALDAEARKVAVKDGIATDPESGRQFRLPRIRDSQILQEEGPEAWMRALLVEGDYDPAMEDEIARAAPVLSHDIQAPCPSCEAVNLVRFDISDYLTRAVRRDVAFLWREVHLIARTYGWTLDEILSLSRDVRRELAGFVVSDSTQLRAAS